MPKRLENKVAIVTGASKGIGAAIALHLADEGASVVVNYSSSQKEAEQIVEAIHNKGGKAIAVKANVSSEQEIQYLFSETVNTFGKLDILVNNAGVYEFLPLEDINREHFHKLFDINVLGLLLVTKEAIKHFCPTGGCVINISSVASTAALPTASVYSATKAAVDAITKSLSKELGPRKIRVNAINPGLVETEGVHAIGYHEGVARTSTELKTPLGRIGQPKDIAPAVVFLASDDASWITGETFYISGGYR